MSGLLLDTNAFIRMVVGEPLRPEARVAIAHAAQEGSLWVSAVTAWEIGLLAQTSRTGGGLKITGEASDWFRASCRNARLQPLPLSADAALAATVLPEPFHRDPADRFLVAQARHGALAIVTRDRAILDYAAAGHVLAIAC